jgi:uncharacterized protein (TIGR02996 family)
MTDHDALLRAICESPDDDTPRLIYADFLEDAGEAERAAFVRAQVELARTPDWEPFAVRLRTRQREWSEAGEPFRDSLPPLGPDVTWHSEPFRRGLGWRVNVSNLRTWAAIAPRLYRFAPVGELYLKAAATRDDWQEFAAGEWVKHFRVIHLEGGSPVEPLLALCANPAVAGITDIHFHRASSPGLPELVEDMLASPLGRGLKGLHFAVGYQSVDALLDSLVESKAMLERLSFHTMGLTVDRLDRLLQAPICSELLELSLSNDRLESELDDEHPEWPSRLPETLTSLRIENGFLRYGDLEAIAASGAHPSLRVLDLSRDYNLRYMDELFQSEFLENLRVLALRNCQLLPEPWRKLVQSEVWMNLVHADLRGNPIGEAAYRRLMQAPLPPNLTALHLDPPEEGERLAALRGKYGDTLTVGESRP